MHQAVLQRAVQREVTEQLVVAQMLADLLVPESKTLKRESLREEGTAYAKPSASSSSSRHARPPPFPRDRSISSATPLSRKTPYPSQKDDQGDDEDDDGDEQPRVPYGIADLVWFSMKKKLSEAIPKLSKFTRKQEVQGTNGDRGGKIVWVMGAGETSFGGGRGISGATDAARESLALSLSSELGEESHMQPCSDPCYADSENRLKGTLGVHVSTVTTGMPIPSIQSRATSTDLMITIPIQVL